MKRLIPTLCLALIPSLAAAANAGCSVSEADRLARAAVDAGCKERSLAVQKVRDLGPNGLDALLAIYDRETRVNPATPEAVNAHNERIQRIVSTIDDVAAQRDATYSRLYWYTDINKAKAAAEDQKKPILSLRLLGNLTDEYSCANSRFFRTTLYPNAEVSKFLRDNFVLHWESVRPVPKITVDFGDGRKLDCTITGNSIHYVLDSRGRIVDGIPGLYGPKAFVAQLQTALPFANECGELCSRSYPVRLKEFHAKQAEEVVKAWRGDFIKLATPFCRVTKQAAQAAANKADQELPKTAPELEAYMNDGRWQQLANVHWADAQLDDASVKLISRRYPTGEKAATAAVSKTAVETPLLRMIRKFTGSIALDTVKNEYLLHRKIHERLAKESTLGEVGPINEWVYAALFLTPLSDPWMGLSESDVFTALENGGRTK